MSRKVLLIVLLLSGALVAALGQEEGAGRFDLLIVDETKTFSSSMRVEVFARALLRTELFALSAKIVEVESSFVDPLRGEEPDQRYDLIVIFPVGIDDGTVRQIWIVSRPFPEIGEELRGAVALVKQLADKIFRGAAEAVGVTDDLIPGYFATIFIRGGWL